MPSLESRMLLHRFMCSQFGYTNLRDMLTPLDNVSNQLAGNESSLFAQTLLLHLKRNLSVTAEAIARYDENITAHSQTLGMTDEKGKSWKPFQYLALLFTERYLDLYFEDSAILIAELNKWKNRQPQWRNRSKTAIADYTLDDLHTLAFQSATGSGKTLLLHANILQYKHYLKAHKRLHKLNKIVLVTPDAGLSGQHLRELQASNIPARLFSDNEGADIFSHRGAMVDIIDIHKLDEKKGIKRVSTESFEENNLVVVDEGHLGVGGKKWRALRKRLARNGFTLEYSATFNQAVAGSGEEIKKLRDEYGKSILFDYSYKFFHEAGYGKDYCISNLQNTEDGETNNLYLLACLLMFYQQCRIYRDKGGQWRDFNLAPPLWVFLGKTVTGGKSASLMQTQTDVIRIIQFLAWVQSRQQQVVQGITRLTSGNTGLVDESGADIFSDSFPHIKAQNIYQDLCETVFLGKGQLQISHLSGADELQCKVGDAKPFGVVNVGDASRLYTKLEAVENRLFSLSKDAFAKPLFADVDNHNSPVNIVIGARKFTAGWNSWRVSTMGLMHVGTGEGPQIIQMFGRGVRLKGRGMSLKRHTALAGATPPDADQLKLLETLNIFGLKANYMDKFKEYLQKEGIKVDRVTFALPTRKQFGNVKDLKILKKREQAGEFQYSGKRLDLPEQPDTKDTITLDRYKYLQVLDSGASQTDNAAKEKRTLTKRHLDLINTRSVYHKVLQRKSRFAWHNLTITQATVNQLLQKNDWYALYIPPEKLEPSEYGRVREWESLAVDLVCEYANQYWRRERSKWEHEHIEVVPLSDENPNYVAEYALAVDAKEDALISKIRQLVEKAESGGEYPEVLKSGKVKISFLKSAFHAYLPLLHAKPGAAVQITPLPLNEEEFKFVGYLKDVAENYKQDFLQDKEIYLMRNMSRGKGVSFFEDYAFYPDFVVWIKDSKKQHILFIDPKGLARFDSSVKSKVDLHTRIKDTEKKIQKTNPELFLHSYIWSVTPPKEIGSDRAMSIQECHAQGIFLAIWAEAEIIRLLQHALMGN